MSILGDHFISKPYYYRIVNGHVTVSSLRLLGIKQLKHLYACVWWVVIKVTVSRIYCSGTIMFFMAADFKMS